jgi:Domain of unknown function (DUF4334)/GXWXG protein
MSVETELLAIIESGAVCSASSLMPMFDRLDPVSAEFMLGTWHGGRFDGGATPDPINWYGKRFTSAEHVEPLLCRAQDGSIYSYTKLGLAQLREVACRGKVSASLIYDTQPIMDYFRKVTKDVVIGLGDIKGKPLDFFFHLTRD